MKKDEEVLQAVYSSCVISLLNLYKFENYKIFYSVPLIPALPFVLTAE